MNRLKQECSWFRNLSKVNTLIVLIFSYTAYWYLASYVLKYITDEPAKPFLHQLLKVLYFGTVFTIFFHWKKVKQLFQRS